MVAPEPRALFQGFLPDDGQRSYVWKYSESIGGRRPRHFHLEPELNLVVKGSATFGVGDRVAHVNEGELLAFPAGQDHVLLESSPDLYLFAIGLDPRYSAEVLRTDGDGIMPLHLRLGRDELEVASERARALVDKAGADQLAAELWERMHWLGRHAVEHANRTPHVLTRRTLARLAAAPELGLEALARDFRTQPSEISRHFHQDVGMTLVRYRMRSRLLRFIRSVDAGKKDLTTAAGVAGFGSYSQCHRTFQTELGCSPRDFFASGLREAMQARYDLPSM